MLGIRVSRNSALLTRAGSGLLYTAPTYEPVGNFGTAGNPQITPFFDAPDYPCVVQGFVQRPFLLYAGILSQSLPTLGTQQHYFQYDNGSANSRMALVATPGASGALPSATFENVPTQFKLDITRARARLINAATPVQQQAATVAASATGNRLSFRWSSDNNAGGGNRYDIHYTGVQVFKDNALHLTRMILEGSVKFFIGPLATVAIVDVDTSGNIACDLGDVYFPVSVRLEAYTGPGASGRKYGATTVKVSGGDLYRGPAPAPVVYPPSSPLVRTGWTCSGFRNLNAPANAIDGNLSNRWNNNPPFTPGVTWFQVDTGVLQQIGTVDVKDPFAADDQISDTGDVMISDDAATWKKVATWTAATIAANPSYASYTVSWIPKTTRYVRLIPTSPLHNSGAGYWGIGEINLYPTHP